MYDSAQTKEQRFIICHSTLHSEHLVDIKTEAGWRAVVLFMFNNEEDLNTFLFKSLHYEAQ